MGEPHDSNERPADPVAPAPAHVPASGDAIAWDATMSLLGDRFLWWDFFKTAGLASTIMWVLVAGMGWIVEGEPAILPVVIVPMAFGVLMVLFALASLLMGNRYSSRFEVSSVGVAWAAAPRESKINSAVTILGALAGSATTTGAGLLAKSNEDGVIEWWEVGRLNAHPRERVISVRNSWRVVIRLHCPPELFDAIVARCEAELAEAQAQRAAEVAAEPAAMPRPWWSRIAWFALCIVLTVLMFAWYWLESDTEVASRLALIGGVLVALAAALDDPWRLVFGALGAIGVGFQAWALVYSALDPVTVPTLDPSLGVLEVQSYSATLDTGQLVMAGAATLGLLAIAGWRVFGKRA